MLVLHVLDVIPNPTHLIQNDQDHNQASEELASFESGVLEKRNIPNRIETVEDQSPGPVLDTVHLLNSHFLYRKLSSTGTQRQLDLSMALSSGATSSLKFPVVSSQTSFLLTGQIYFLTSVLCHLLRCIEQYWKSLH